MSYLNSYVPPTPPPIDAERIFAQGVGEWDHNFCIPKAVRDLENDKVKIVPWIPSLHAKPYYEALVTSPETFQYYPLGPFPDVLSVVATMEKYARRNQAVLLYAILDKTKKVRDENGNESWPMAGTIGFLNTLPHCLSLEIGYLVILPEFRRTHITSNAIGLLTLFALTPRTSTLMPEFPDGGLGYRRVQYQSHPLNEPSIRAAERLGFVKEGVQKWQRVVLSLAREGKKRPGDGPEVFGGIDCLILALCWDEWDESNIRKAMAWMGTKNENVA